MHLPDWLRRRLYHRAVRTMMHRPPDVIIGTADNPYMHRWHLIPRNRWLNLYLHRFWRSDDDRALHDHPWWNCSLLLAGSYVEHMIAAGGIHRRERLTAGALRLRPAKAAHRIELEPSEAGPQPCLTLFATGPRIRDWGFHCPRGWVPWRVFTSDVTPLDGSGPRVSSIGRGCGEDDHA